MDHDSGEIHVAKSESEDWESGGRSKDEEDSRDHKRTAKVTQAIWKPRQQIQHVGLIGGQNVAQIGAIEDVFERGQDFNPYRRSPFGGDESVKTKLAVFLYNQL